MYENMWQKQKKKTKDIRKRVEEKTVKKTEKDWSD